MNFYPVILNLENRNVVVIGGGTVAHRKVVDLIRNKAQVTVISPKVCYELHTLSMKESHVLQLKVRPYTYGDLENASLVFSTTDDRTTNENVAKEAHEKNIWINTVDDPENCSFYVPAMIQKGDLLVAVSTCGSSPAMASRVKSELEQHIPQDIEYDLNTLRTLRELLKDDESFQGLTSSDRGEILKTIAHDDDLLDDLQLQEKSELLKILQEISEEILLTE